MNNIPLVNIANKGRMVYLFSRKNNQLIINKDSSFYPFFFEPDERGNYLSYDGVPLKKVIVGNPKEVALRRSKDSYSSDIKYTKVYLTEKVDKIEKSNYRYAFLDIETQSSNEFPDPQLAKYPISCITYWDNYSKEYNTWFLPEYHTEKEMLDDFVEYINNNTPDLILGWNGVNFDYCYIEKRIKNFAKKISPIHSVRGGEGNMFYPAGISIVDYLMMFKKVFMREKIFNLDYIGEKYLGKGKKYKNKDLNFGSLDSEIKYRNIDDVKMLVALEEKYNLLPYYDEVRRLSLSVWEDLIYNSRTIEMLVLKEAKRREVILPNKKENKGEEIRGAIRDSLVLGDYYNVGAADLSGAYPNCIISFCLDSNNIVSNKEKNTIEVNGLYFKQDENALVPSVVKRLLVLKNELKPKAKKDPSLRNLYMAIKGIANSAYGVLLNEHFRLFDSRVGSSTTYLVRSVLDYVINRVEEDGYKVVYYDTDSCFYNTKEDITDKLNGYIQDWAREKGKDKINLEFDYEGYFDRIFFLGRCHYFAYMHGEKEPEIKGIEIKRSSSSKYEAYFQRELIEKIFAKENVDSIVSWIKSEMIRIKSLDPTEFGFPFRKNNKKYVYEPIFIRAYNNTKYLYGEELNTTKSMYYTYIKERMYNNNKAIDVIAFSDDFKDFLKKEEIDWDKMMDRNIVSKAEKIFEAKGWNINLIKPQTTLF